MKNLKNMTYIGGGLYIKDNHDSIALAEKTYNELMAQGYAPNEIILDPFVGYIPRKNMKKGIDK